MKQLYFRYAWNLIVAIILSAPCLPLLFADEHLMLQAVSQPEGNLLRSISLQTHEQAIKAVVIRISGQDDLLIPREQLLATETVVARVSGQDAFYLSASIEDGEKTRIKLRYLASFPRNYERFELDLRRDEKGEWLLTNPLNGDDVAWLYLASRKVLGLVIGIESHSLSKDKPTFKD